MTVNTGIPDRSYNPAVPDGKYLVTGSCKRCGKCCVLLMRKRVMLIRGKVRDPSDVCRYLSYDGDIATCEIREAVNDGDWDFINLLPEKVLEYWVDECKDYPDPNRKAHTPERFILPEYCGFKMTVQ